MLAFWNQDFDAYDRFHWKENIKRKTQGTERINWFETTIETTIPSREESRQSYSSETKLKALVTLSVNSIKTRGRYNQIISEFVNSQVRFRIKKSVSPKFFCFPYVGVFWPLALNWYELRKKTTNNKVLQRTTYDNPIFQLFIIPFEIVLNFFSLAQEKTMFTVFSRSSILLFPKSKTNFCLFFLIFLHGDLWYDSALSWVIARFEKSVGKFKVK